MVNGCCGGLTPKDQLRRPLDQMWSIAEYTDHVREVLFGMRYLLDTAISQPATDLGESPPSQFDSQPRQIDVDAAPEPVKANETSSQDFFCASLSMVGLLIHAAVGSLGGLGFRFPNRHGLAA